MVLLLHVFICRNDRGTWVSLEGYNGDPRVLMETRLTRLYAQERICCKRGSGVFGLNEAEATPGQDDVQRRAKLDVLKDFPDQFERNKK
jgi:hypothetical protein